jgi:hypothetical protein
MALATEVLMNSPSLEEDRFEQDVEAVEEHRFRAGFLAHRRQGLTYLQRRVFRNLCPAAADGLHFSVAHAHQDGQAQDDVAGGVSIDHSHGLRTGRSIFQYTPKMVGDSCRPILWG